MNQEKNQVEVNKSKKGSNWSKFLIKVIFNSHQGIQALLAYLGIRALAARVTQLTVWYRIFEFFP